MRRLGGFGHGRDRIARVVTHHAARGIQHLERHPPGGRRVQPVVDDRARRRIQSVRHLRRQRRVPPDVAPDAQGLARGEQVHRLGHHAGLHLAERGDVVENPHPPSVRSCHQVMPLDPQVAHRRGRQVELQRLPVITVVEGDVHAVLRAGEEQAPAHGIGADDSCDAPRRVIHRQAVRDARPRLAEVARAVEEGRMKSQAHVLDGRVGRAGHVRRGFERDDVGATRIRHLRDADVGPRLSFVARQVDESVGRAHPDHTAPHGGRGERLDRAAPAARVGGGGRVETLGNAKLG